MKSILVMNLILNMKKLLFPLLLLISPVVFAQQVTISGTVKNPEGNGISTAIILTQEGSKAKTDSLGHFTVQANPVTTLAIHSVGYKDTLVNVDHQNNLVIIMHGVVTITAHVTSPSAKIPDANQSINMAPMATKMTQENNVNTTSMQARQITMHGGQTVNVISDEGFDASRGAIFPVFHPKQETQGSRYFFKDWAHGSVIKVDGQAVADPNYLFNYDKMGGGLLLSKDGHSAIEVNRDIVKTFTITDDNSQTATFANMPSIDKTHYVQVLADGDKYKIYKVIKTKFDKANFSTDGLMNTGNDFDSYTDEGDYYLVDAKTNAVQKVVMKKKALKALFPSDADKVNKFLSDHAEDNMDDSYLANLGSYVNQ